MRCAYWLPSLLVCKEYLRFMVRPSQDVFRSIAKTCSLVAGALNPKVLYWTLVPPHTVTRLMLRRRDDHRRGQLWWGATAGE